MQNFLILRELQTEFLKFKIHFAKISYKEFLIKKLSVYMKSRRHISLSCFKFKNVTKFFIGIVSQKDLSSLGHSQKITVE